LRTLRQVFQFGESSPRKEKHNTTTATAKQLMLTMFQKDIVPRAYLKTDIRDRSQYGSHEQQDK